MKNTRMESEFKEEIEAFLNAPMDIGRSTHELSLKAELDYENQSKMSTCDQITDSKSPVSEHNSLSGESDSRLTKAIEKEVCGGRIAKVVSVSLEDSFEGCNQQKLCPYQMATVTVKKEEEEEEEDDSSQQPAAVEDDYSQQHYLIPGYNMIFIKEEAYETTKDTSSSDHDMPSSQSVLSIVESDKEREYRPTTSSSQADSCKEDEAYFIDKTASSPTPPPITSSQDYSGDHSEIIDGEQSEGEEEHEKTSKRVRNKDYCFYCKTMISTFARHIIRNHSKEMEVQQILSCKKNSSRRKTLLSILRKKGNFLATKTGIIRRVRKSADDNETIGPLPCTFCLGLYKRSALWKHRKKCPLNPGSSCRVAAQAAGLAMITNDFKADHELRQNIFPIMRPDEVTIAVQKDTLICEYGSRFLQTHYKRHQFAICSRKMRELGRLLITAKKIDPSIRNLIHALRPQCFETLVASARIEAGHNVIDNSYASPRYAMNIGTSLKDCCGIAIFHVQKRKFCIPGKTASELEEELKTTKMLIESNWNVELSHAASSCLQQNKMNKITIVPLASDLKKFRDYLIDKGDEAVETLKIDSNNKLAYKTLSEVLYCRVVLLCRRRVGELERLTVELYQSVRIDSCYEEFEDVIKPSERILLQKFKRVVVPGKRRTSPVLFSPDVQEKIKILIELRDKFVRETNPYLFPTIASDSPIVGYEVLKDHANRANLKTPGAFSLKSLRKHLSTISQLFDMSEQDVEQLSSFMGHTVNIHRNEYRLPDNVFQTSKIAKLLLAMEKGEASKYKGLTLDEIEVNLEDNLLEEQEHVESSGEEQVDNFEDEGVLNEEKSPNVFPLKILKMLNSPSKSKAKRELVKWEDEEKRIVAAFFSSHIENKIAPKKRECELLIEKNPILQTKTWVKVKVFVQNIYTKKN
ncbi:uncharacterized protein LOC111054622 isoform X12 [Nilaparvata lugens]|uniref:uncharacterized protein LOC111054622 isoform X12 n=1 Tax=Nilaparvata lugens TaxID=108931 RepID=UPI00193E43EA|nr:uncharacterized protein LOC111054622 isoform X12 [Nilaparvata lugens]